MTRTKNSDKQIEIDDFIHIIRDKSEINTIFFEAHELEKLIKSMWKLLTPAQCVRFTNSQNVKSLLAHDNTPPACGGYQGSMGGFGTEELEEWQRTTRYPTS